MTKIRIATATVLIAVFLFAPAVHAEATNSAPGEERLGELIANVNVRAEPNIRGAVVSGLPKSTRVRIWQERQGWVQVTARPPAVAISGWVFGRYIKSGHSNPDQSIQMPPARQPATATQPPATANPSMATEATPMPTPQIRPSAPIPSTPIPPTPVAPVQIASTRPVSPNPMPVTQTGDPELTRAKVSSTAQVAPAPQAALPVKEAAAVASPSPSSQQGRFQPPNPWPWMVRSVMFIAALIALTMAVGQNRRLNALHRSSDMQSAFGQTT